MSRSAIRRQKDLPTAAVTMRIGSSILTLVRRSSSLLAVVMSYPSVNARAGEISKLYTELCSVHHVLLCAIQPSFMRTHRRCRNGQTKSRTCYRRSRSPHISLTQLIKTPPYLRASIASLCSHSKLGREMARGGMVGIRQGACAARVSGALEKTTTNQVANEGVHQGLLAGAVRGDKEGEPASSHVSRYRAR